MASFPHRALALGPVFQDTGRVLTQRGPVLMILAFLTVAPGAVAAAWLRAHPLIWPEGLVNFAPGLAGWMAQIVATCIFYGGAVWCVARTLEDAPAGLGRMIATGLRLAPSVVAVQILYTVGMVGGMVLLVVPGVILAVMWILSIQALVVERVGVIDAFRRSRALTKGHRWLLFGLFAAYGVGAIVLEKLLFMLVTPGTSFVAAAARPINSYGTMPVLSAVLAPLSVVVTTVVYLRLSAQHLGQADRTAEVFA